MIEAGVDLLFITCKIRALDLGTLGGLIARSGYNCLFFKQLALNAVGIN